MISTSICVFGVGFLLLLYIYFPRISARMRASNNRDCNIQIPYKRIIAMLVTFLIFSIICSAPLIYGGEGGVASVINLLYSYFDSPSLLAVLMICMACFRQCVKIAGIYGYNSYLSDIVIRSENFNGYCALLLFVYGCVLYGGSLGMIDFDIYHATLLWQCVACFLLLILLYVCGPVTAYLGILTLILSYIYIYNDFKNKSILENFICPYLWVYCVLYLIYAAIRHLYNILNTRL